MMREGREPSLVQKTRSPRMGNVSYMGVFLVRGNSGNCETLSKVWPCRRSVVECKKSCVITGRQAGNRMSESVDQRVLERLDKLIKVGEGMMGHKTWPDAWRKDGALFVGWRVQCLVCLKEV